MQSISIHNVKDVSCRIFTGPQTGCVSLTLVVEAEDGNLTEVAMFDISMDLALSIQKAILKPAETLRGAA